jgi:hypothetical protein
MFHNYVMTMVDIPPDLASLSGLTGHTPQPRESEYLPIPQ